MKISSNTKLKFILVFLFLPLSLFGQEESWFTFDLDNVQIDFPTEEVYQLDTILKGFELKQLYGYVGNSTFMIQMLPAERDLKDRNFSGLPYDYESLMKYYGNIVEGTNSKVKAEHVIKEEVKLGELIGQRAIYYDAETAPTLESRIFLAGDLLLMMSIYQPVEGANDFNETFFSSLNLDGLASVDQYTGKSQSYRQGYLIGQLLGPVLLGIIIFVVVRLLVRKR